MSDPPLSTSPASSWRWRFAPPAAQTQRNPRKRRVDEQRREIRSSPSTPVRRGQGGETTTTSASRSHPSSPQRRMATPFRSLAILKLSQVLPDYCRHLAVPTLENVTAACAVLDSSIATATSSPTTSPSSSPHAPPRGHSPRLSPVAGFLPWLPSSSERLSPGRYPPHHYQHHVGHSPPLTTSSSSALALESEWDNVQRGFLVLAAAEFLYAQGDQVRHARSLRGLYDYVTGHLTQQVHATLCEPFLGAAPPPAARASSSSTNTTTRNNKYVHAAQAVARMLQSLLTLAQVRIQLMELQSNLFTVGLVDPHVLQAVTVLCRVTETSLATTTGDEIEQVPAGGAAVEQALLQELKIWKYLLAASCGLERCEFLPTLVNLRHCQRSLRLPARTPLEKWWHESCQALVALLPIYLDRTATFAKPLYGFDASTNSLSDWELHVTDFLRKQERAAGPATAVAVVLDALGAGNLHMERGYQVQREQVNDEIDPEDLPERTLWPAVYMRSTQHLDATAPITRSTGRTSGSGMLRRGGGSSSKYSMSEFPSDNSASRLFTSSARNLERDVRATMPKSHVMEYGPDTGTATTWPHNEWGSLVSLLELSPVVEDGVGGDLPAEPKESIRMAEEPVAVTYRQDAVADEKEEVEANTWMPRESLEKAVRLFSVYASSDINVVDQQAVREHAKRQSTYHIVSLGKYLSLVVMVKSEEESHFLRRRSPLTDEEIRTFMDRLALEWRVSSLFSHDRLPKRSNTRIDLVHEEWDSDKLDDLVMNIKSTFGLRPMNYPLSENRGISFLGRNSPKKASRRRVPVQAADDTQSAATLFLGSKLANLFEL